MKKTISLKNTLLLLSHATPQLPSLQATQLPANGVHGEPQGREHPEHPQKVL